MDQEGPGESAPADGAEIIAATVVEGSTIYADEASAYDVLAAKFLTKRINHSVEYANGDTSTNMAESFFSRLRRAETGIHHHIAGPYLSAVRDGNGVAGRQPPRLERRAIPAGDRRGPGSSGQPPVEGLLAAPSLNFGDSPGESHGVREGRRPPWTAKRRPRS